MPVIQIVGGIAAGKSTLLETVTSTWRIAARKDPFEQNVFLTDFYDDPVANAFETELLFALLHYRELKRVRDDVQRMLCDFSLLQDAAYADVTLVGSRQTIFLNLIDELSAATPQPLAILHVRCAAAEQLRRIAQRGRSFEQGITVEYLEAVNGRIAARVREASCPVLEIDSNTIDYRDNADGIRTLIDRVLAV